MSQNKRNEHANHYFDLRVLENYCRNDILLTFEFAGRQAGRLIAKKECGKSGCDARCRYNAICEAAHMTYKLIKRQSDLYNIKRSVKDDNN